MRTVLLSSHVEGIAVLLHKAHIRVNLIIENGQSGVSLRSPLLLGVMLLLVVLALLGLLVSQRNWGQFLLLSSLNFLSALLLVIGAFLAALGFL